MALLAVGGGTLIVGKDLIGTGAAVAADAVLFTVGTAIGLVTAVALPYLMVVRHKVEPRQATPSGCSPWCRPWSPPPSARC